MYLREAFDYEFSRLDPSGAHIDPPSVAIYETLMVKGPDWQPHPMLAKSWQVSEDRLTWRVLLRPGLRFHSGAPCDAQAVVRAFDFLRWHLAEEGQLWYWDPVDKVSADGNETLVFKLHYPYSRLPALLWGTHTAVFNEALRAEQTNRFGFTIADGTGPFKLASWSRGRVVAERWSGYAGLPAPFMEQNGPARLDGVEWISILDERERLEALERGEVHCLHGPPLDAVDGLREAGRFEVIEYPQASNAYLALNWDYRAFGFDDVRVRRAFSLGIDRAKLVQDALHGHGSATLGPVPPGDEYYDAAVDAESGYDPAQAARLLELVGWQIGNDGVRQHNGRSLAFVCVCQDDGVQRRIAKGARDQLAKLGVRLELRFVKPFEDFYAEVARGPASFISKWLWQDPIDALIGFCATRGQPFPNWQKASVASLDRAFAVWLRADTKDELRAAASAVQREVADKLPYIPLLTPNDVWVHSRQLHGWRPYPANLYPFYQDVWLDT